MSVCVGNLKSFEKNFWFMPCHLVCFLLIFRTALFQKASSQILGKNLEVAIWGWRLSTIPRMLPRVTWNDSEAQSQEYAPGTTLCVDPKENKIVADAIRILTLLLLQCVLERSGQETRSVESLFYSRKWPWFASLCIFPQCLFVFLQW